MSWHSVSGHVLWCSEVRVIMWKCVEGTEIEARKSKTKTKTRNAQTWNIVNMFKREMKADTSS